jgi:hypothetical protein
MNGIVLRMLMCIRDEHSFTTENIGERKVLSALFRKGYIWKDLGTKELRVSERGLKLLEEVQNESKDN